MTAWIERQAANHHVQLAATAVISGLAVAGIIYGTQAARRKVAVDDLKASIPQVNENYHAQKVCYLHLVKASGDSFIQLLTVSVKLTEFGSASPIGITTKEEDRAAALAKRAQGGGYDEGRAIPC